MHRTGKSTGRKCADLPMKLRRRQSDAKWRANVASCYETLKHIIPVNKRASKRQISKALILQETSKHINFLENILRTLLLEKAEKDSLNGEGEWVESRIHEIKEDFVQRQGEKMNQMNEERRYKRNRYKRYITDHMMQESIQSTASVRSVILQQSQQQQATHNASANSDNPTATCTGGPSTSKKRKRIDSTSSENQEVPLSEMDRQNKLIDGRNNNKIDAYVPVTIKPDLLHTFGLDSSQENEHQQVPNFLPVNEGNYSRNYLSGVDDVPSQGINFPNDGMSYLEPPETSAPPSTPVKCKKNNQQQITPGCFTPVKLPTDWSLCPPTPVRGTFTPKGARYSPSAPSSTKSGYDSDAHSLMCNEDMWLSDEEENKKIPEHTPDLHDCHTGLRQVTARRRKRCQSDRSQQSDVPLTKRKNTTDQDENPCNCRRSLDISLKQEPSWENDQGKSDFDGYLLFYKNMVRKLEHMEPGAECERVSQVIYNMWQELPIEKKLTIKSMANRETGEEAEQSLCHQEVITESETMNFDESFWPLPQIDPDKLDKDDKDEVPEMLIAQFLNMSEDEASTVPIEITEVDVKPIVPLSPFGSSDDNSCPFKFSDVSPLFGTNISNILTNIKTEQS